MLTKFHDDDVMQTKIMAILSTGFSGIFSVSYRNIWRKETTLILKYIDQLPQNLARVHNLVHSFDTNFENFKFFYRFHCILLFAYCLCFVLTLMLFQRYRRFTNGKI